MVKRCVIAVALAALMSAPMAAQNAATVIANASKAMGVDTLNSIHYYGSGANYALGQSNNANGPWPRTNLNDYVRAIDFAQPASRASAVTWAVPVTGGAAAQGAFNQNITPANDTWAQQLEIWVTPWGFLKGAQANNATVRNQTIDRQRYQVVSWMTPQRSPSGQQYRVVGYINAQTNLVDRVETWLENPIFGDMHVEVLYNHYRDSDGLKFPSEIVQKRGGWPTFDAHILGAHANPPNIQALLQPPAPAGGRGGAPGAGQRGGGPPAGGPPAAAAGAGGQRQGGPPAGRGGGAPQAQGGSEKLGEGVYRIRGGYNALAVEFSDHVLLFEPGPQNEMRAQEIIDETKRTIPNKPIRYGVISHHHFDHTSGLPAVVAEGITIVTHEVNKDFFEQALNAPRTLAPDAMARSGRKARIETVGDLRVFKDDTQVVEVHNIKGLPHADGMLIVYLPRERLVAYADMFNLPPAATPVPDPPVVGSRVFADNLVRLKLNAERIMSVHSLNPDRLTSLAEIQKTLGR
jgi:glyoxylase-like metal-dependent hydrolase (beta-lactamase superfamily II)